jgi:hypothetical protein
VRAGSGLRLPEAINSRLKRLLWLNIWYQAVPADDYFALLHGSQPPAGLPTGVGVIIFARAKREIGIDTNRFIDLHTKRHDLGNWIICIRDVDEMWFSIAYPLMINKLLNATLTDSFCWFLFLTSLWVEGVKLEIISDQAGLEKYNEKCRK